jgi:hypothetical protein
MVCIQTHARVAPKAGVWPKAVDDVAKMDALLAGWANKPWFCIPKPVAAFPPNVLCVAGPKEVFPNRGAPPSEGPRPGLAPAYQ